MKIGIVGFGSVGQAMYHIIQDKKSIVIYDKFSDKFSNSEVLRGCNIVIACLPTPTYENGKQDFTAFEEMFDLFKAYNESPLFLVKSTVLYQSIEPYLKDFRIVMNPEFLNQNSSFADSKNQKVIVLGGRVDLLHLAEEFYHQHTCLEAMFEYMSIREAIEFKYIRNIYGAYKVLFWNWVQEQTGNARKHAELYSRIPQGEMSQVAADGKPGYGGGCFVKDVSAWHESHLHELTAFMQSYNSKLRHDKE